MRISDGISDVCSSELIRRAGSVAAATLRQELTRSGVCDACTWPLKTAGKNENNKIRISDERKTGLSGRKDSGIVPILASRRYLGVQNETRPACAGLVCHAGLRLQAAIWRSEERRGGKEGVSTRRYRWSPYH